MTKDKRLLARLARFEELEKENFLNNCSAVKNFLEEEELQEYRAELTQDLFLNFITQKDYDETISLTDRESMQNAIYTVSSNLYL